MPGAKPVNTELQLTRLDLMHIDLKITVLYCGAADISTVSASCDKKFAYAAEFYNGVSSS